MDTIDRRAEQFLCAVLVTAAAILGWLISRLAS